jgi:hypothetical protein
MVFKGFCELRQEQDIVDLDGVIELSPDAARSDRECLQAPRLTKI